MRCVSLSSRRIGVVAFLDLFVFVSFVVLAFVLLYIGRRNSSLLFLLHMSVAACVCPGVDLLLRVRLYRPHVLFHHPFGPYLFPIWLFRSLFL